MLGAFQIDNHVVLSDILISVNLRVGQPAFRTAIPCQACFRRWQSTAAGTTDETVNANLEEEEHELTWLQKAKKRSWLWRWLNDVDEIERNVSSS